MGTQTLSDPEEMEELEPTENTTEEGDREDHDVEEHASEEHALPRLRVLFQNREVVLDHLWNNIAEFPNLNGFSVALTTAVILLTLTTKFFILHFGSCLSLLLAFLHYQDAARFPRCVSGAGDIYIPIVNILVRNFVSLYVLDKFVLSMATFHEATVSASTNMGFFGVLFRVLLTEMFIMYVTLLCKILVSKLPSVSKAHKRRIYQWLEYTGVLYRFPIPFVQWVVYLDGFSWTFLYSVVKFLIGLSICWSWLRISIRLFCYAHLGSTPREEELKHAEHCTICFGEFTAPIKLNCGHIFCSDCIRTWLDREVTCPICRAIVTKEDNHYRRGNSIFPMHAF